VLYKTSMKSPQGSMLSKYLSPAEVARHIGVDYQTVMKWMKKGVFPGAIRVGRNYRIPRSEVTAWMVPVCPPEDQAPPAPEKTDPGPEPDDIE